MIYELREYVAHEATVPQVHARFAEHTLPLFAEHGLDVVGFWVDQEDPTRVLYLLEFDGPDAQERAWAAFQDDPAWQQAKADSEAHGPIVASMSSRTLEPVPYWRPDLARDTARDNASTTSGAQR
jgi:NIPSNAP